MLHMKHSTYVLYFQDDNRYSAGRGSHLNLRRAEKARILVTKIPGIKFTLYAASLANYVTALVNLDSPLNYLKYQLKLPISYQYGFSTGICYPSLINIMMNLMTFEQAWWTTSQAGHLHGRMRRTRHSCMMGYVHLILFFA